MTERSVPRDPPRVRLAGMADVDGLAATATAAFAVDPLMRWLYPDADYFEIADSAHQRLAERWVTMGSLWCTNDGLAMAGWIPPDAPDVAWRTTDVIDPEWRIERFGVIRDALAAHAPAEPHWYLNMLATHPDAQRRGLGAAVMNPGIEAADRDGVACYLETQTAANVGFYQGRSFAVSAEWDVPLGGPHMWAMLRRPRRRVTG